MSDEVNTESVFLPPGEISRGHRAWKTRGGGVVANKQKILSLIKYADEIRMSRSVTQAHTWTHT